jgi:hypothetical protein
VTIGTGAIAIGVLITRAGGIEFWRSRRVLIAALLVGAGLLVYAYLPIAASRKPAINWGDPSTVSAAFDHITGKQYRSYVKTAAGQNSAQLGRYFGIVGRELGPSWLPFVLLITGAGIVLLFFRQRTIFWYVVLFIAANAAWFTIYPVANDTSAYAIPTFIALLLAFAVGASAIATLPRTERGRCIAAGTMLILPFVSLITTYPFRDRSRYWVSHDYAANAFRSMRPNALLITGDWQLYSPMRYALDVERTRSDVEAIQTGLLLRRWYFGELARHYPTLARDSHSEIDALTPMVSEFENDREHLDHVLFSRRIDDFIISVIDQHLRRGPVYVTTDIASRNVPRDVNLRRRILETWDAVPRGLLIEILPKHATRDVLFTKLETRGIGDDTVGYDNDDVVPNEIMPAYRAMYVITGRYLAIEKKFDESLLAYRAALALDPGNASVEREMATIASGAAK